MQSPDPSSSSGGRLVRYGLGMGAVAGAIVAGVLGALALVADPPADAYLVVLTVIVGSIVGATIGAVSAACAAVAHGALRHRASIGTTESAAIVSAAVAAGSTWFAVARAVEWLQPIWMTITVGLFGAALAAVALAQIRGPNRAMSHRVAWVALGAIVLGGLGVLSAGTAGVGPLAGSLGATETRLPPVVVATVSSPGDPRALLVGVAWSEDGYCGGQLTVLASETPSEVRLADVINREHHNYRNLPCAGLGSDGTAWAVVELEEPLGDRAVVRDRDGSELPVRAG